MVVRSKFVVAFDDVYAFHIDKGLNPEEVIGEDGGSQFGLDA